MGQDDARHETSREALSDSLDRDIAQRRQRLAELGSAQRQDERTFTELWAQLAWARTELKRSRAQLIADSRERTTLLGELDQLLQRQVHRDNAAAPETRDADPHPEGAATDIREFSPVPPAGTPTGISEWSHPGGPPPRAHAGPPPRPTGVPTLFGPRAPEPPRDGSPAASLADLDGDTVTQVSPRPLRSAAFQPQSQAMSLPVDPSEPPVQAPPPQAPPPERLAPSPRPQPPPRSAATTVPAPPAPRAVAMAVEVELGTHQAAGAVGFSERVSEAGLYVVTQSPRRVGERLPIQFTLPGHHRAIACEAEISRVVHSLPPTECGLLLRFVNLSAHDRAALVRFIAQRETAY